MAEHHDKSKQHKDGKGKDFDLNLEIPHKSPPDDLEVVDEVIEVVEETAPGQAPGETPDTVPDVLEVVEEGSGPSPDEPQIVDEAVDEARAPKKTPIKGRDPQQTMLASEMKRELEASAPLGEEAFEASDHIDVAQPDEVLDAEEASDLRMEPAPAATDKKLGTDTHADVELGGGKPEEPFDVVEAPPSSSTIAAALAESDDDIPQHAKTEVDEIEEMDKTVALPGPTQAAAKQPPGKDTQLDVEVEYEDGLVDGESEVDLGRKSGTKADRPSGVDIIAEALESGVDLDRSKSPAPKGKGLTEDSDLAYESILDEGGRGTELDSSAVDLGSGQSAALRDESAELSPAPSARGESILDDHGAAEDIDESVLLGSGETDLAEEEEILVTPKKKTVTVPAEEVEEPAIEEAAGLLDEEKPIKPRAKKAMALADKGEGEGEGGGTATMTRTRKQRSRMIPFVMGGFLATLLLAVGAGAMWYLAPQLLSDFVQGSPNAPKAIKGIGTGTGTGAGTGSVAPLVASKAQEARKLIDDGKFDEAIAMTKEDAEKKDADALVVHGLATFMQLQKDAKAPLTEQDEAVQKALQEIEQGGAKAVAADLRGKLLLNKTLIDQADTVQAAKDKSMKLEALEKLLTEAKLPSEAGKLKATVDDLKKSQDATKAIMKTLAIKAPADPGAVAKAVDEVIKKRDELNDSVGKLEDSLKKVNEAIVKAGGKDGYTKGVEELVAVRDAAVKDRDALNSAIDAALKELKDANLLTADGDKAKQLVEGTKKARFAGQSPIGSSLGAMVSGLGSLTKEPLGFFKKAMDNAKTAADLKATQLQLALAESPDERLDMILAVLKERGTADAKVLTGFKNYIDWARSKEAKVSPEARVKALYAAALLQRNRDDFAAARQSLEETVKEAKALKAGGNLETAAKKTLAEISDPAAFYLPRVLAKIADGQLQPALDDLNSSLKVLPGSPQLLLKRAEVELLLAKAKGKIEEPTQKRIRADAEGARKDPRFAAESHYIVGQMDEHNGDYSGAESNYREALKLAPQGQEGDRYRIALARVLQRDRTGAPLPEVEPATDDDATQADGDVQDVMFCSEPWQQGDDEAQAAKRLEESIKLANELIQSPDAKTRGEGYLLLGSAQARQGKKTEGLKNFVKGLELVNPGMATKDLAKIVETHPAFTQPDIELQANPVQAERNFGKGLEFFWAKKYAQAEGEFKQAVSYYDQDARYRYFLGLSRYLQNTKEKKTAAAFDFEQGARLEAARKPGAREINSSLERIQGDLRRVLNTYREKMASAG